MRLNISVPDDLAEQVRDRDLPTSAICQTALRSAVEQAKKKEQFDSDLDAVVERLRATQSEASTRHFQEAHDLGVLWAKQYATADQLRVVADLTAYEAGFGIAVEPYEEFFENVDHNFDPEYLFEWREGFGDGANEVWEAVKDRLM